MLALLNVIDNPGYFDFAGQIVQSLRVVDAGLICLTAKSGIGVGTEKGWKYLAKAGLPAMFYVSKLDEEHANFFNVLDSLREMFGASVIPATFQSSSPEGPSFPRRWLRNWRWKPIIDLRKDSVFPSNVSNKPEQSLRSQSQRQFESASSLSRTFGPARP